jgi:hypothetical protein
LLKRKGFLWMRRIALAAFFTVAAFIGVALAVLIVLAWVAYTRIGHKVSKYDNVGFWGTEKIAAMTVHGPPPDNVEIILENGTAIRLKEITRESMLLAFSSPPEIIESRSGHFEMFSSGRCAISLKDGKFESLDVSDGVTIRNIASDQKLTLPSTEKRMKEVFGKPTAIKYVNSRQP